MKATVTSQTRNDYSALPVHLSGHPSTAARHQRRALFTFNDKLASDTLMIKSLAYTK